MATTKKQTRNVALAWARDLGTNISLAEQVVREEYGRYIYGIIDNHGRVKINYTFKPIPWNGIKGCAIVRMPDPEKVGRDPIKMARIVKTILVKKMKSLPLSFWAEDVD